MIIDPHQMIQTEHTRSYPGYRCIYIGYQPKSGYAWSGHILARRPRCEPANLSSHHIIVTQTPLWGRRSQGDLDWDPF